MDKMQEYEVQMMVENIPYADVSQWEQVRMMVFVYAQSMSTKQLKPTDLMSFAWDDVGKNIEISNADIERLKQKSALIMSQMQ